MPILRKLNNAWGVALAAVVVSVSTYVYFYRRGEVLFYKDAISHMEIARRVVDATTPGIGQLGGVWLPLPHILMLPFVWVDALYYDGFAGSIVCMLCFVISAVFIYRIVYDLTENKLAAWVGAIVFMTNPNVVYMQATPMTELLLFATMLGMVYGVQRWIQTDRFAYLIGAAAASVLATLSRYEAWTLLAVLGFVVVLTLWRRRVTWKRSEDLILASGVLGLAGIGAWLVWNWVIFGNPLFFQVGEYAKPSLWVGSGELSLGHWNIAAETYLTAVGLNLWPILVVMSLGGLVLIIARERLALRTLPVLSLIVFIPFFVVALEKGQRPLHVTSLNGELYNVRFGLILVLPAAILTGYLMTILRRFSLREVALVPIALGLLLLPAVLSYVRPNSIITLQEPQQDQQKTYDQLSNAASTYMRLHYDGEPVLMESFGNELLLFKAKIDFSNQVYEGSYQQWAPALADPAEHHIEWIVMRHSETGNDKVYQRLNGTVQLRPYELVYRNDQYSIYRKG